jgi:hypothetical protein
VKRNSKTVGASGASSGILRLRRKIPLLFGEDLYAGGPSFGHDVFSVSDEDLPTHARGAGAVVIAAGKAHRFLVRFDKPADLRVSIDNRSIQFS